jgi:hypothetical protein
MLEQFQHSNTSIFYKREANVPCIESQVPTPYLVNLSVSKMSSTPSGSKTFSTFRCAIKVSPKIIGLYPGVVKAFLC